MKVHLRDPAETATGTLNKINATGCYLLVDTYGRSGPECVYYPTARIVKIEDFGYRPR